MTISNEDYVFLVRLLAEKSGIELGQGKEYLIESRLQSLAVKLGSKDISGLIHNLRTKNDPTLLCSIIDSMTTNESLFFRDGTPFELLKNKIIPELLESQVQKKRISIWSAACSSGQEPYSIAMSILSSGRNLDGWKIEILATDLCSTVMQKAREGIYSQFEIQRGLPPEMLSRYFIQHSQGWQINEQVKRMVVFKEMNLIESFSHVGPFDIIFCRNVLIYFGIESKKKVLENLANRLEPNGFLVLGGSETLLGVTEIFEKMKEETASIYKKNQNFGRT